MGLPFQRLSHRFWTYHCRHCLQPWYIHTKYTMTWWIYWMLFRLPEPDLKFSGYFSLIGLKVFNRCLNDTEWCHRKSSVKVLPVLAVHPPHNVLPVWEGHSGTTRSDKLRYLPWSESRFVQFKASTKTYEILLVPHSALPKGSAMNCIDLMVAYHDIPPLKKGVTWGIFKKTTQLWQRAIVWMEPKVCRWMFPTDGGPPSWSKPPLPSSPELDVGQVSHR